MSNNIKARSKLLIKLCQRNFDYGQGLYANMDKYKSISDFEHHKNDINHIDYPNDSQIQSDPIIGNSGSSYEDSVPISYMEGYTDLPDQNDKSQSDITFGEDTYSKENNNSLSKEDLDDLINKYLSPAESDLFGFFDGVSPADHDADQYTQEEPYIGVSDIGTQIYEDKWNI